MLTSGAGLDVANALKQYFSADREAIGKEACIRHGSRGLEQGLSADAQGMKLQLLRAIQPRIVEIRELWQEARGCNKTKVLS